MIHYVHIRLGPLEGYQRLYRCCYIGLIMVRLCVGFFWFIKNAGLCIPFVLEPARELLAVQEHLELRCLERSQTPRLETLRRCYS